MRSRYSAAVACAVLLAALRTTPQAVAQGRDGLHHLAVVAGPVNYDLSGTGWSWGAGARLDLPLARILTVEGGITYFQYEAQFGSRVSYVFPEIGAHLVVPTRVLRPYLLVGGGAALSLEGGAGTDLAVHAGIGVRTAGDGAYGARIEGRFRNITLSANASLLEVFAGLSRRW
jgi:hypothetical protein